MKYNIEIIPHTLQFKQPAGTSRGTYTQRKVWYIKLTTPHTPHHQAWGECAPLIDLSCDYNHNYEATLHHHCQLTAQTGTIDYEALRPYPSILFGLETALLHHKAQSFRLFDTPFSRGETGITINGLIWMGTYDHMAQQIENKLTSGYHCIKLKIGAIHFDHELELLQRIRTRYSADQITLRVDANGAFTPDEAPTKLAQLAQLQLHSIEQPIRAGQPLAMAQLARTTPLPIALDEELIGIHTPEAKRTLLETIHPQYIILKPTLHGGIKGCNEWITLANELNIGWWITSALESNIGLNAIAQWTATLNTHTPQGLGTGQLFEQNYPMPLEIKGDQLYYNDTNK